MVDMSLYPNNHPNTPTPPRVARGATRHTDGYKPARVYDKYDSETKAFFHRSISSAGSLHTTWTTRRPIPTPTARCLCFSASLLGFFDLGLGLVIVRDWDQRAMRVTLLVLIEPAQPR